MDRHKNRKKYKAVAVDGKTKKEHRLIMEDVVGCKLQPEEHVHHLDGNGMNNDISNLEILPEKVHNQISGRATRPAAKLLIDDIPVIRKMLKDKVRQYIIAFAYGVDRGTISHIKTGYNWSWV